eukprot:TRINITY_DN5773_c0_g1_i2.p1 TRINITY_DN5773_c0_g1~~TRINITY_DN5773_c0_g1_i2.p1  ORF type:complete len:911 (-),score=194.35 TRINITY_DN5773_c0_g1_i2:35-2719(-)
MEAAWTNRWAQEAPAAVAETILEADSLGLVAETEVEMSAEEDEPPNPSPRRHQLQRHALQDEASGATSLPADVLCEPVSSTGMEASMVSSPRAPRKRLRRLQAAPSTPDWATGLEGGSSCSRSKPRQHGSGAPQTPTPDVAVAAATTGEPPAHNAPKLDSSLKTFVINLKRRPDRLAHMEGLCKELGLDYEVVQAVDGQELKAQPGASFEVVIDPGKKGDRKRVLSPEPTEAKHPPRGFKGLRIRSWRAKFPGGSQLLQMAEHRLKPSQLTDQGHELWGAVGCSLSHQAVLKKILQDEELEHALVLEDDCVLGGGLSAAEVRQLFSDEMASLSKTYPDWQLIYLGGSISSMVRKQDLESWRVNPRILAAKQVYQTHAFVIRRGLVQEILEKLHRGKAADAAFVSWSRSPKAANQCFLFHPQGLLQQAGGADRWKDSDIFIEGEFFKQAARKRAGGSYDFATAMKSRRMVRKMDVTRQAFTASVASSLACSSLPRFARHRTTPEGKVPQRLADEPSAGLAGLLKQAWQRAQKLLQDTDLLATVQEVLGLEACGFWKELKPQLDSSNLTDKAQELRALRGQLDETARGLELVVQLHRSALAAAVACAAAQPDWQESVLATAKYLWAASSNKEASSSQPAVAGQGKQLAAAIRCALEFHWGVPADVAESLQGLLCLSPSQRGRKGSGLKDVEALVGSSAAGIKPRPALKVEASVLGDLLERLQGCLRRLSVVKQGADSLGELLGAVVSFAAAQASSLTKPAAATPLVEEPIPLQLPEAGPTSCIPLVDATGRSMNEGAHDDQVMDMQAAGTEASSREEKPRRKPRPSRSIGGLQQKAEQGAGIPRFHATREELCALTVPQLRSKARFCGAPGGRLLACLEKHDLVEAVLAGASGSTQ